MKILFIVNILPVRPEVFVSIIGFHDSILALLLFAGVATRKVAVWASLWIIGVMIVTANLLGVLEHAGFLFMAIALIINNEYLNHSN